MILISIPVKNHVKKYLAKRYGTTHQVSKKTFIGLFLLQLLEKKIDKPEKETEKALKKEIIEKFLAANKPHDWIKYYKLAPKI